MSSKLLSSVLAASLVLVSTAACTAKSSGAANDSAAGTSQGTSAAALSSVASDSTWGTTTSANTFNTEETHSSHASETTNSITLAPASDVVSTRPTDSTSGGSDSESTVTTADSASTSAPSPVITSAGLGSFICPDRPYAATPVPEDAVAVRVANVPPSDDFASSTAVVILEGPVWLDGNLYLSQINNGEPFGFPGNMPGGDAAVEVADAGPPQAPPSRILKLTSEGVVSVLIDDSGSNGLALDVDGSIVATNHKDGAITRYGVAGEAPIDLVSTYQGARFNSPNDITIGADGTVYFTDPDYQAPSPRPQEQTRAYRLPPGATAPFPFAEDRRQPNGVTLSPDRSVLYLSASDGVFAYPVALDGSLGEGVPFAQDLVRSSDGMAVDCAGNLYTTTAQTVLIVSPQGTEVGRIAVPDVQSVSNVAFGGPDHRTIFITALGAGDRTGLFSLIGDIPGMPY